MPSCLPRLIASTLLALFVAFPAPGLAQETERIPPEQRIEPPQGGEPEVTVIQKPDATITEYRSGGRVYMVRVDPDWGPAYYLVDDNGDGTLNDRIGPQISVPQWTLFEW